LTKKTKEQQKTPKKQLNGNEKTPKKEAITPKGQEKTPKGQKTPIPKTPDANKSLINVILYLLFYIIYFMFVNYF